MLDCCNKNSPRYIPKIMHRNRYIELGRVLQRNPPVTNGGIKVTISNPFFSANSRAACSVLVLAATYEVPNNFKDLWYSISLHVLSSTTSLLFPLWETVDALEVYTTLFTVLEFRQAFNIPRVPCTDFLVTISSSSSLVGLGWATWKTPMHPSIAASKLSGWSRSALKMWSFSDAPGRLVR